MDQSIWTKHVVQFMLDYQSFAEITTPVPKLQALNFFDIVSKVFNCNLQNNKLWSIGMTFKIF